MEEKKKNVIKIPKEIQKNKQEACACNANCSMRFAVETQTFEFSTNTSIAKHILKIKTLKNPINLQYKLLCLNEMELKSQNFFYFICKLY